MQRDVLVLCFEVGMMNVEQWRVVAKRFPALP